MALKPSGPASWRRSRALWTGMPASTAKAASTKARSPRQIARTMSEGVSRLLRCRWRASSAASAARELGEGLAQARRRLGDEALKDGDGKLDAPRHRLLDRLVLTVPVEHALQRG